MTFAQIPAGAAIFLDANTLVYHLKRIERHQLPGVVSTHVLSEVAPKPAAKPCSCSADRSHPELGPFFATRSPRNGCKLHRGRDIDTVSQLGSIRRFLPQRPAISTSEALLTPLSSCSRRRHHAGHLSADAGETEIRHSSIEATPAPPGVVRCLRNERIVEEHGASRRSKFATRGVDSIRDYGFSWTRKKYSPA
jgi:hypothetical protein